MHIITRRRLTQFWNKHPDAEAPLRAWHGLMEKQKYSNAHQVKEDFPNTDFLGNGLTVFDIGGNKYRLVALMRYRIGRVFIRHILTHAEYDKLIKAKRL